MQLRLFFTLFQFLIFSYSNAQTLFFTKDGYIEFFSSTPIEDIKAVNSQVNNVLNISNGEIEFSLLIMAFQFEKALMQEHFNEKFMESSKFPKAVFKGIIVNNKKINYTENGEYPAKVKGEITIHGVTRNLEVTGKVKVKESGIEANADFILQPADFDIVIPALVRENIAREIHVEVNTNLKPYTK